jgi:C4-dicarboxylate-specific signal transduction histidine kinase
VLDLVHSELIVRRVGVKQQLAPALPFVSGDRVQMQQMVLNLILNACDAMTDTAQPNRHVTITTALAEDGFVRVSIADRGTGVAVDALERIFDPFFTSKPNRLGLGLSICRYIAASHAGRLWVVNTAEGGATFHFVLPRAGVASPAAASTRSAGLRSGGV